jgi:hypothetical protein
VDSIQPTAEAGGPYNVPEGGMVQLSASPSPGAFQWDLDGDGVFGETGAAAVRGNESGATPTFDATTLDGPVFAMVTLRVDNGLDGMATDTAVINVLNVPPVADAGGPYAVAQGAAILLSGSGGDVPGDSLIFDWDLDGDGVFGETGAAAAHGQELGPAPVFNSAGLPAGAVTVTFRANDGEGGLATDTATIAVEAPKAHEFRVNTFANGLQQSPASAMDDQGNFVITWSSGFQLGEESNFDVYAQRYDAAGEPQGEEFRVNTFTLSTQATPSIAMGADGDFVIAWESFEQDGSGAGVFAQRFDAAGAPQGPEFRVSTFAPGHQAAPSVAMNANGDFVVAWQSDLQGGDPLGIYAQAFNAAGAPQGGEFHVNVFTPNGQAQPSVAMADDGSFVIAWQSFGQQNSDTRVYARRYNPTRQPGPEFPVHSSTAANGSEASVAMDADGEFVITWTGNEHSTSRQIYARMYNSAGAPKASAFRVNTFPASQLPYPSVAMNAHGNFVIAWRSRFQDGSDFGAYAQRYNAAGQPQGGEFQVNVTTDNYQQFPSPAIDSSGNLVIAWQSGHGFGSGIYTRLFPAGPVVGPFFADDGDAGYSQTGDWISQTGLGHNQDFRAAVQGGGTAGIASWTFNVPQPGQYRVSGTWLANPDFYASNAPFLVIDGSTPRGAVRMNQKLAPDDLFDAGSAWENLGVFNITGSTITVQLTPVGADGYVIADAIRIERVGDLLNIPEIQVTEGLSDVPDDAALIDYGTADLGQPLSKTFTISNTGLQPLELTSPISLPAGYTLVTPPPLTTIASGQTTTFVVRLDAALPGTYDGQISFGTNDADEGVFNFQLTGTVLAAGIIDDGEPGFSVSPPAAWGTHASGLGRDGDFRYARDVSGDEIATWTFHVAPGQYRLSATWFAGSQYYDGTAQFTIFDGSPDDAASVRGGRDLDQQSNPDDRAHAGSNWEDIGAFSIHSGTLSVTLTADDPLLFVLADAVLIERLGDVPTGPEVAIFDGLREVTAGSTVDFGTTQLLRTFTITNSGSSPLEITGPITVPDGYELHSGPALTSLEPGEETSLAIRLAPGSPGTKTGQVVVSTNDADESLLIFEVTGTVLPWQILDDGDPGYTETGDFQSVAVSIARDGDNSYVHHQAAPSEASWTFTVAPGRYRIAATWFETAGNQYFATNAPFTVLAGETPLGTVLIDQRHAPGDFMDDGSHWEFLGDAIDVTGGTLTVRLTNVGANGYVLADAIRIIRVEEPENTDGSSLLASAPSSASGPQVVIPPDAALDAALTTAYWNDELDEVASLLAEDALSADRGQPSELATGDPADAREDQALELDLLTSAGRGYSLASVWLAAFSS